MSIGPPDPPPARPGIRPGQVFAGVLAGVALTLAGVYFFDRTGRSAAASAVTDVLAAQKDAWNRGDLDGFLTTYWMSDQTTFYSTPPVPPGWVALQDRFRRKYGGRPEKMGHLEFTEIHTEVLAADAVHVRGRWTTEGEAGTATGLFTLLVRKCPEGWKITHDHTSEDKKN